MPLIGTAGHVDHGKSTLIERITGRDPDRWREEKRRGLTIDLGFAWTSLPGGREVSFVDVPGHEKFLKNMLAGIEAVDVALFVVAADEGWMPQSEEHLAILDLLEVEKGVVAVTKIDLVDPDLAKLAVTEIADNLMGTSLEGVPIVQVSSATGAGIPELLELLERSLPPEPGDGGRPRLWVDRSFAVSGAGTVVTGSLLGGAISVEDTVEVYPRGREGRVRAIQSHEMSHHEVGPGRRVALNIAGVSHDEISRGDMVGRPGDWMTTRRLAATLRPARFVDDVDQRGAYQMHIGSATHRVTITGMQGGRVILQLDEPLVAAVGDRFILRDTGRRLVVAGGRILDPSPGPTGRALAAASLIDPSADPDTVATQLLLTREHDNVARLGAHSGGGHPTGALIAGDEALDASVARRLGELATDMVITEHSEHPLRPGLPLATLAERLGLGAQLTEAVVGMSPTLDRVGPDVRERGHSATLTKAQEAEWQRAEKRLMEGLTVPPESDLGVDQEVIALKIRAGELVRIAPGLVYLPSQVEEIEHLLRSCGAEFTVARFRDVSGLTRKYAVPILEWSDREGLTVRRGDVRRIR
jgi:selenocysteine-specific elongation factor